MLAIEVWVNGQRQCVAGVDGILNVNVGIHHRNPLLSAHGLDTASNEFVRWMNKQGIVPLSVNDEVSLKIVDADDVDEPAERKPR